MDIKKELDDLQQFLDTLSDEEFDEIMMECGHNRIKETADIFTDLEMELDVQYHHSCRFEPFANEYTTYSNELSRNEAA